MELGWSGDTCGVPAAVQQNPLVLYMFLSLRAPPQGRGDLQQDQVLLPQLGARRLRPKSLFSRPLLVLKQGSTLGEQAAQQNMAQTGTSQRGGCFS